MSRLFFALWPDNRTRDAVSTLSEQLPHADGRWVPRNNLHITLVFLGNVSSVQAGCLIDTAARIKTSSCALRLDHLGWWKKAQVLWLAPEQAPVELAMLAAELVAISIRCGIQVEQQHYRPHVTLARKVRKQPLLPGIEPVLWPVCSFSLIRSETRPEGAIYNEIWRSTGI